MSKLLLYLPRKRTKSLVLLLLLLFSAVGILYINSIPPNNNKENNNQDKSSSSSTEVVKSFREQIKVLKDKEMHQLGKHFNKHGRGMGYSSKKEYQKAALEFVEKCKNNPATIIKEGKWNMPIKEERLRQQIALCLENKTVILDKLTGQIMSFYEGTEVRGLIHVIEIL
jgi:hypothetical protein